MITKRANLPGEIALPYIGMSDTAPIDGIAVGDKVAMRVLYARHSVQVFRFAFRLLNNRTAAEDAVSEVFFEVWQKADRFGGRSQVATRLLAITRHKALDVLRQRSAEQLDEDAAALIEDPSDNPEVVVHKQKTSSIVRKCLAHLSPKHREVIDLIYYHGRSTDEAAKIIGVVRNTVKTRMFCARKRLAGLLAAQGIRTTLA